MDSGKCWGLGIFLFNGGLLVDGALGFEPKTFSLKVKTPYPLDYYCPPPPHTQCLQVEGRLWGSNPVPFQQCGAKTAVTVENPTSGHQDAVGVDRQSVDDGVVPGQVLDEVAVGKRPLLDVIGGARGKGVSTESTGRGPRYTILAKI